MALLPNPWDGALPTSKEQPGIAVTPRSFHNVHKRCHSGSYPYKLPRDKPDWLRHYEILGRGPPPTDMDGNPGDIYVDVNPPLVVYYRTMDDWEAWIDRPALDGTVEKLPLVCHPMLIDRYLWRNQQTLTWVTEGTIRSASDNEILPKTTLVDPTDTIADIFRHTSKMNIGGGGDNHHPSFSVSQISGTAGGGKRQEFTP